MDDANDMRLALVRYRGREFAKWLTVTIALAAIEHPKELRNALASVFSVDQIERDTQAAAAMLATIQDDIGGMRDTLAQMQLENKRLMDENERIQQRLNKAGQYAVQIEKRIPVGANGESH